MTRAQYILNLVLICALSLYTPLRALSNLTNNDPYPIYTSAYQHSYLTTNLRNAYKGEEDLGQERIQFSISPFRQAAVVGNDIEGNSGVPLFNLTGPWNFVGLFYPEVNCRTNPDSTNTDVQDSLFTALDCANFLNTGTMRGLLTPPTDNANCSAAINPAYSDPNQQFGFFNVGGTYRKYGVRFQADIQIYCHLGLRLQTGVCDIRQIPAFADQTCQATGLSCPAPDAATQGTVSTPAPDGFVVANSTTTGTCNPSNVCIDVYDAQCKELVIDKIMKQRDTVAETLGLDFDKFDIRGMEDTRANLFLRKVYPVNQGKAGWPFFLFMPYISADVNIPTGKTVCPFKMFALPTGNNGHWGGGLTAGFTIDFVDTIEIGFEGQMTKWAAHSFSNYPVPTNDLQSSIFPRLVTAKVSPGTNWNFSFILNAYHFLDRLSLYADYVITSHGEDSYKFPKYPEGFNPDVIQIDKMIAESKWEAQVCNVGLNYDISPNFALGFLWQAPVTRRNAYRSTTLMTSLVLTY